MYKRQHLQCAWENGFTAMTVGCPILIGDGLKGTDDIEDVYKRQRQLPVLRRILIIRTLERRQ